jgi:hypothetical protein
MSASGRSPDGHPNPWAGATITKLSIIRTGAPIAFFSVHFPLLEATLIDCTLRRTKIRRLWCAPPKRKRALANGTAQYDDIIEWDGGGVASRFNSACLEAMQHHTPEVLAPLLEGRGEFSVHSPALLVAPGWERDS